MNVNFIIKLSNNFIDTWISLEKYLQHDPMSCGSDTMPSLNLLHGGQPCHKYTKERIKQFKS